MKRILCIFIILLLNFTVQAQSYSYAWLTDLHIGAPNADIDLNSIIQDINTRNDISFIIVTGDVTEKGKNEELDKCKKLLDILKHPYFIIPGNHDTKWSESGGTKFNELWENNNFIFNEGTDWHAGLNSGIIFRGGGGHIIPEDIEWLRDTLSQVNPARLFIYIHHPLTEETDNWFKLTNLLKDYNPVLVFCGHGHQIKKFNIAGATSLMGRSSLSRDNLAGYNLVSVNDDSLQLSEIIPGTSEKEIFAIPFSSSVTTAVDSVQFINYSAADVNLKDFNSTVSAPLYAADGRIFISTYKDGIHCLDYNANKLWDYNPGGTIISKPILHDGILVTATAEGDLSGLEAHTGKLIQVIGIGESITSQLQIIDVRYEKEQTKGILVGTGNGNLYCYDLYTFEMIWENNSASGMIETKPLVYNGAVVFGAWDGCLYSINQNSGVLNWKWSESKNFYYSPAAVIPETDGKNIYICAPDKNVYAIDLLLGTTVWKKNYNGWETMTLDKKKESIYLKSTEDIFYILNTNDGSIVKKIEIKYGTDTMPSPPVETEDQIFFGSRNGKLYSITKKDYKWSEELFLGTARLHSVITLAPGKLAAINMDGKLAIISY